MPKNELDFAPSRGLAALEGIFKGISDVYKQKKEQEAARIQQESALFRQLWPTLFQEQGRQRRFEAEQRAALQQFGIEQMFKEREFEQKQTEFEANLAQTQTEFKAKLEDMQARRDEWEKDYDLRRDALTETERHNKASESLDQLSETIGIMKAMLASTTQLAISGTFKDQTTAAENLAKLTSQLQEDVQRSLQTMKDTAEVKAKEVARGEETVDDWQRAYNDFMTNNRIMQSYLKAKAEGDRDTMLSLAPRVGGILDSFYQRWLKLPEATRPPIESLDRMKEFQETHGWIFKRERPAFELVPREQETLGPPSPTSAADVLKKYDISDTGNRLEKIKAMSEPAKSEAWQPYYRWLKTNKVSEKDIAIIEQELGIK